jgi:hypothetical protein
MKRIKVLRSLGLGLPRFVEGQVVEVDDETCGQLIAAGLAELIRAVPDPGKVLEAVPPEAPLDMGDVPPADPEPVVDRFEQTRRQPGYAKRSKRQIDKGD